MPTGRDWSIYSTVHTKGWPLPPEFILNTGYGLPAISRNNNEKMIALKKV